MKTAIVYVSAHHGNTKKLVDAISKRTDVVLINADETDRADLQQFDYIGFASGVAYGRYYPQLLSFMECSLPEHKNVFFMHTAGNPMENYNAAAKAIADARSCRCLGTYFCKGYDTCLPIMLIDGIAKGHPDTEEVQGAWDFFDNIMKAG